jgi:hypothetical protein
VDEQRDMAGMAGRTYADPLERGPAWRRLAYRVGELRHLGWDLGVRAMTRATGQHRGEHLDFRLAASARDLVAEKSRAVRDEMETLAQAVMRAGSYPAREEATRAFHAAMDALKERVPPDVLLKLSEHLPEVEAVRLRESLRHRLDH